MPESGGWIESIQYGNNRRDYTWRTDVSVRRRRTGRTLSGFCAHRIDNVSLLRGAAELDIGARESAAGWKCDNKWDRERYGEVAGHSRSYELRFAEDSGRHRNL